MAVTNQTILDRLNGSEVYFAEQLDLRFTNDQMAFSNDCSLEEHLNCIFYLISALRFRTDREVYDQITIDIYNRLVREIPFNLYDSELDPNWEEIGNIIIPDDTVLYKTFLSLEDTPNTYIGHAQNLVYVNNSENMVDFYSLDSKTLVSPTISPTWTLFKNDGTTPYSPSTSSSKNIVVDNGVKANLSATYQYPNAITGQANPTSVSGDFGTILPAPATPSTPLVKTTITSSEIDTVTLAKPKSGLIVIGSQVQFPTGNDTTLDSISITFSGRSYLGYSTNTVLSPSDILGLGNKVFANSRVRTVLGVTAGVGFYTYIVYDAAFGDLTNIIMDGAAPVLGAVTKLTDVTVVNDAGINVLMRIYKSNATNAFTNNTLAIS